MEDTRKPICPVCGHYYADYGLKSLWSCAYDVYAPVAVYKHYAAGRQCTRQLCSIEAAELMEPMLNPPGEYIIGIDEGRQPDRTVITMYDYQGRIESVVEKINNQPSPEDWHETYIRNCEKLNERVKQEMINDLYGE